MDTETFSLRWDDEERTETAGVVACEEVIYNTESTSYSNIEAETIIPDTDQMAAENLMYLAQDMGYTEVAELEDDHGVECVTEEVITDDWVVPGGQERVEVPLEHLTQPIPDMKESNDIDVPLPTDQDEYTAMRPYPCDFCSRRFRKKNALMNHMVAHQSDRPHACNLCGVRYVRKSDLMNHLKVHAYVPDNPGDMDFDDVLDNHHVVRPKKKRGRRKKPVPEPPEEDNEIWENMTSARTQQWSRKRTANTEPLPAAPLPPSPPSPVSSPSPVEPSPPSPPPRPVDPRRPFTCKHCGIGFAREKALQSHARVHGGDSPIECGVCGDLCWSREALASHQRRRHPNLPPPPDPEYREDNSGVDDDDIDYRLSPSAESVSGERIVHDTVRGPELFCQHCGVAFQRADLLRRHVAAAHSYKRHDSVGSSGYEHTCDVCGETCADALQLLAHAERHAARSATDHRIKTKNKSRNSTSNSNSSKLFPCRECGAMTSLLVDSVARGRSPGKVFGSRSSQQIHVRIHTGERPYACRFCWKAFADGGTLRKHERIHTGEKPYACAVCPRAFNQRVVLREHVRSHHSAPDRRANGGPSYCCVVCGRILHSSAELVQHLIQHCDANTALRRQPQSGPRKYKRRKKLKTGSPFGLAASSSSEKWSPPPSPERSPPRARARRRRAPSPPPPPPRPRMIHTAEDTRPRTKQVRNRRPPRHPADDLRAIRPHLPPQSPPPAPPEPQEPVIVKKESIVVKRQPIVVKKDSAPLKKQPVVMKKEVITAKEDMVDVKSEPSEDEEPNRSSSSSQFRCEMCDLQFETRDDLLMHVPVHI